MKLLIVLVLTSLTIYSFGQAMSPNGIEGIIINPKIEEEAQKNIESVKEFEDIKLGMCIYKSKVAIELYENDSLILSTMNNPKYILSKSFYFWRGDTLMIDGGIGLAISAGFSLKLVKNNATIYHMLISDDSPTYAYGETTDLIYRINIPCHDVKVILSGLPEKGANQIIYGYVEFKSDIYFVSQGTVDGKEMGPRKKSRSNMKIYFKSGLLDL